MRMRRRSPARSTAHHLDADNAVFPRQRARDALMVKRVDKVDQAPFQRKLAFPQPERDRMAAGRLRKPSHL
jgi:hypothetical protein